MGEFEILDTDEPLKARMERHAFDRLIMLSDGVFSIAITLAALEIRPPEHWSGGLVDLTRRLQGPLTAYAISFAVIGVYWMAHRRMIARMRRVDGVATALNLALLAVVALQPAAVQVLMRTGPVGPTAGAYLAQVVAIGVIQSLLWGYAAFVGNLVDPAIRRSARVFILGVSLTLPVIGASLSLFASSLSSPPVQLGVILVLALVVAARRWADRRFGL